MKKAALRLLILIATASSAGCGDSWPKILTNEVNMAHEYVDVLMKIVDEDSAKFYKKDYLDRITTSWADLQHRKEPYAKMWFNSIVADIKSREDLGRLKIPKDVEEEFAFPLNANYQREAMSIGPRLAQQTQRIRGLVARMNAQGMDTT